MAEQPSHAVNHCAAALVSLNKYNQTFILLGSGNHLIKVWLRML